MFPLVGAVAASAECFFPWHILPVSCNQPLRDFVSGNLHLELEAVITGLISKNQNYFQRAEKRQKMIIKTVEILSELMSKRQTLSYFTIILWVLFGIIPALTEAELGCKMQSGLGCSYAHSVLRKWPGSYCTVVLSILWQAFPKALWYSNWQLSFYCCARSEMFGCQGQGDVPRNRLVSSSVFQTGHCKSSSPGTICLQLRHHGRQLKSSHVVVPGIGVVPWARSPSHRQVIWVIYTLPGQMYFS